ncbi:hypothetical protein CTEN210_01145 [Chaetoceros tenuissimus]|uniref:Cysteine dioxygenase n=1 Tax=Chaetoceros tenuissimus TaxID=426638 RepID=A0AAD3GZF7_9STRA|nr:hypothetical protein CTEN210_01145 [Chaetoceros tenuissimus]
MKIPKVSIIQYVLTVSTANVFTNSNSYSGQVSAFSFTPSLFRFNLKEVGSNQGWMQTALKMANLDPEFYRRRRETKNINDCVQLDDDDNQEAFNALGDLAIEGQGAVGFKFVMDDNAKEVRFRFDPAKGNDIDSGESSPHPIFHTISNEKGWVITDLVTCEELAGPVYDDRGLPLLNPGRNQTFWMSFDKENLSIKGGSGYMLTALQLVEKRFEEPQDVYNQTVHEKKLKEYQNKYGKISKYSMDPSSIKQDEDGCKIVELITSKYPITQDLPPIVKDHQDITLEDLDTRTAISIKELSPECQRLYENVAGASIKISPPDFPDFAQAIDYSINFGFCKETLARKAQGEFEGGKSDYDANQAYLRVTLGSNLGDSPGIPYVMEIWPAGCYSPIHDHSQANAIIKVLHGSLTTRWFESLDRVQQQKELLTSTCNPVPYKQAVISEGDVTWLDDRQFQTHQLFNHNVDGTACITIQCYMYNNRDVSHYENFDYIGGTDNEIIGFVPNSDWDYECFKQLLKEEFSKYKENAAPVPDLKPRGGT